MKKSILLLVVAILCFETKAQELPRRAGLGVGYYPVVPDSIAQKLNYKEGAVVRFIVPNSTSAALGILPNDIIIQVNETAIKKPTELSVVAKTIRANQLTSVTVNRNGQLVKLKASAVELPRETDAKADIIYGSFPYGKGQVRTIYKSLKNKKPLGTVFFLQGLPCYSMDNFTALDKTKQAIDAMVERGFAVYRMEKGDMGDNLGQNPCASMGFNEELAMYRAGYQHLLTLKEVDTSKIFLFGHSMGGVTAPLITDIHQPKGIVVYGTVFKSWMDYMLDAFVLQPVHYGADLAVLRDSLELFKPFIYDYFYHNKSLEEICKNPTGKAALENVLGYDVNTGLAASGRIPLVFKEINGHNLAKAWGNTQSNVLAIYGECDIAAINPDDHQALINFINKRYPGKGSFWLAPGTTHTFEEIGTMQDFVNKQQEPQAFALYAAQHFNPKVFDKVCLWMNEILSR